MFQFLPQSLGLFIQPDNFLFDCSPLLFLFPEIGSTSLSRLAEVDVGGMKEFMLRTIRFCVR
jgi:hypothetical protein